MRYVLFLSFLLALAAACREEEEILPAPPPSVNAPAGPVEAIPQQNQNPSFGLDSDTFEYGSFKDMPYRILWPRKFDAAKTYPLHIFLHGIGERGTDNEAPLAVGGAHFEADSIREAYPAVVIFPQCPNSQYWFSETMTRKLRALIDSVVAHPNIDVKKISIGGFSMGAYGTFAMVASYPDLFQSAIAISGDGDETKANQMKRSQWRLFAGGRDSVVPSRKTEKMAKALSKAGASVSFTLYPESDHGRTWTHALSEPDFFRWLFAPRGNH